MGITTLARRTARKIARACELTGYGVEAAEVAREAIEDAAPEIIENAIAIALRNELHTLRTALKKSQT